MSTITGIFIPFIDGSYTSIDIVTEIDSSELNVFYYQLQALNPADSNISGDVPDIFVLAEGTNKRYYSQMSLATQNLINLPDLKKQKIEELQNLYTQAQVVKLLDNIEFHLPLQGNFYIQFKDRLSASKFNFFGWVLFNLANGDSYKAYVPHIFLSEIYFTCNPYSELNKITLDLLVAKINSLQDINLLNALDIQSVFTLCPDIDLDQLINDTNAMSDQQLLDETYSQKDIDYFKQWVLDLPKDSNNKYIIFTKSTV